MDGIHDLGGMHGFGDVPLDDASFHADWERKVFAMNRLLSTQGLYEVDEYRHAVERMDPADYLDSTYFERWLAGLETLLVEKDVLTTEEIAERTERIAAGESVPDDGHPDLLRVAQDAFEGDRRSEREPEVPSFAPGDEVVVRNNSPAGHTRVPRYVRRAHGTVQKLQGTFPLPDAVVRGEDEPEPVYSVRFTARELWGVEHAEADALCIDMWESYIEAAP